jgi:UV DNA damage endonuclease
MNIRFGYACITNTLEITTSHTITYKNLEKLDNDKKNQKIKEIVNKNLDNLMEVLKYNKKNEIYFYRMSSKIFPLATHPKVKYNFIKNHKEKMDKIGRYIRENNMRVDIHLDQFCVLNSTNEQTVKSTINIIKFYKNMFKALKINSYMIIHIGSGKNGKEKSIERFIKNFNRLDKESQKKLIIENDDKIFNIKDTLYISKKLKIPMVLDYHHYVCNNNDEKLEIYLKEIFDTWKNDIPKVHISSKKNSKNYRNHNDYININDAIKLIEIIKYEKRNIDIMIEAKQKDNAMFKLIRELKYKDYKFINETTLNLN